MLRARRNHPRTVPSGTASRSSIGRWPSPQAWANNAARRPRPCRAAWAGSYRPTGQWLSGRPGNEPVSAAANGAVRQAFEANALARDPRALTTTHSHTRAGQRTVPLRRPRRHSPPLSRSRPRSTVRSSALPVWRRKGHLGLDDDHPNRPGATRPRPAGVKTRYRITQGLPPASSPMNTARPRARWRWRAVRLHRSRRSTPRRSVDNRLRHFRCHDCRMRYWGLAVKSTRSSPRLAS